MQRLTVEECQKIYIKDLGLHIQEEKEIVIDDQLIQLTSSKCYFGGYRMWFLCPDCNRRIGALYRKPLGVEFLCRNCNTLTYQLCTYHRSGQEQLIRLFH